MAAVSVRRALLSWFEPRRSAYPWRRGVTPYRVLVSEIMLQQTQASRVATAFRSFVKRFPSVRSLAAASRPDVLAAWSGLGYNRRAVALHEAARVIVTQHRGRFPRRAAALQRLPGVGPYTAAAVASIAFDTPVAAVDVNVHRVLARLVLGVDASSVTVADVADTAALLISTERPGDWNQAVMDLGREICTSRDPSCDVCPVRRWCVFVANEGRTDPPRRRQSRFEGSLRQARGAIVRELTRAPKHAASVEQLVTRSGVERERIVAAIEALADDGMVDASPAALRGAPRSMVRLAG